MKTSKQNSRIGNKTLAAKRKKKTMEFSDMPDLSNDPYVLKKAEEAREMLIKYVVPTLGK